MKQRRLTAGKSGRRDFPADQLGPVPLDETLRFSEVPVHRNLKCPRYHTCLSLACRNGWISFSCRACPVFWRAEKRGRSPATEAVKELVLLVLLSAIVDPVSVLGGVVRCT